MQPMPLLVFVQGSGWTTPNRGFQIPMLGHLAEEGWTVASISHRDIHQDAAFPAFLLDVKCAVRFLRVHAREYAIDPRRVAIWGTSSGGHAALLAGLTGDAPALKTEEYAEQSDAVQAVVTCFAPTDLQTLFAHPEQPRTRATLKAAFGPDESCWDSEMHRWSPVHLVQPGQAYPPMLLMQGTMDPLVPVAQMEILYSRLKEAGASVEAMYVDGARHEGSFWTRESRDTVFRFLRRMI